MIIWVVFLDTRIFALMTIFCFLFFTTFFLIRFLYGLEFLLAGWLVLKGVGCLVEEEEKEVGAGR